MTNLVHQTRLKCFLNPKLRTLQYWTDEPYVIASVFEKGEFITYKFTRVKYNRETIYNKNVVLTKIQVLHPFRQTIKHIWRKLWQN